MSITTEIQRLQTAKADIKSAIEEKGIEVGEGTIDTYADKVREISVGGSEVIDFSRYSKIFQLATVEGLPEEITLNLDNILATGMTEMFRNLPNKTIKHITVNTPIKVTSMRDSFSITGGYTNVLEHITLNVDTSQVESFLHSFYYERALKVIDGYPLDLSSATSIVNIFEGCTSLEEVRFVPNSIKLNFKIDNATKLSDKTIQSIIEGLADLTGSETRTLTVNKAIGAKLTEEQKAIITAKNWTLVY